VHKFSFWTPLQMGCGTLPRFLVLHKSAHCPTISNYKKCLNIEALHHFWSRFDAIIDIQSFYKFDDFLHYFIVLSKHEKHWLQIFKRVERYFIFIKLICN
jgi:hypothetical protein